MGPAEAPSLAVEVIYCPGPDEVDAVQLSLPLGATVHDALRLSGVLTRHPAVHVAQRRFGIWGKLTGLETPLRDQDRVEVYRPLLVDPKEARRLRHAKQRKLKARPGA